MKVVHNIYRAGQPSEQWVENTGEINVINDSKTDRLGVALLEGALWFAAWILLEPVVWRLVHRKGDA